MFAEEGARSPTVTTIENTRGIDVRALMAAVEQDGFRIADGYAALAGHLRDVMCGSALCDDAFNQGKERVPVGVGEGVVAGQNEDVLGGE